MNDLAVDLMRIGFSEKQAIVYVALLGLGRSSIASIITKTQLKRASVYRALEELKKHGLVLVSKKNEERIYIAEPPERIATLLRLQQHEIEEKRRRADMLIMRLQAVVNTDGTKPRVRYVESVDGLRMMQREYEAYKEDMIQIVGYDAFLALHDPGITKEHRSEIKKDGRAVRSIIVSKRPVTLDGIDYVVIPPEAAPIKGEMTVCGDRVVLFSYANGIVAVEIISKTLAETLRATLELAWNEAKRIGSQE